MKTTDGYELPEEHLEVIRNVCNVNGQEFNILRAWLKYVFIYHNIQRYKMYGASCRLSTHNDHPL